MGSLTGDSGAGIKLSGSYYYIKGITITKAPTKGLLIKSSTANGGSHNIIENCVFSYNGDSGVSINTGNSSGIVNDGTKAAYNYIKNCDSYMNADLTGSTGPGGNADGFSCKLDPGDGNIFYGCRAWYNSDDGFDFYNSNYRIIVDTCWTWHNGDSSKYTGWSGTWGGNGNGFKVGGGNCVGNHVVQNSVAFDHVYGKSGSNIKGFDQNNNIGTVTLYNNLSFGNMYNYGWFNSSGTLYLYSNYGFNAGSAVANIICAVIGDQKPSEIGGLSSDFTSLLESDALAARQSDGSLPDNGFGKHK
jgi:pectate disaccharide-lyase